MSGSIVVINPNSTVAVTEAMDTALDPLRLPGGPKIVSVTNADGPPGIECQAHVDDVSLHIRNIMRAHEAEAAAFFEFEYLRRRNMPAIPPDDPAAVWIGARPGQLVRITRPSETAGIEIEYRVVSQRPG